MTQATAVSTHQEAFEKAMSDFFTDLSGPVGVMVREIGGDHEMTWNHTEVFPTASTLKVPLLYELYRQADAGDIDLTERVTLLHKDRVPGSGVYQNLDEGLQPTIRDLAELMIIVSDNWATDIIFTRLGKDRVAAMLNELQLTQTSLPMTIREMFMTLANLDPTDSTVTYDSLREFLKTYKPAADNIGLASDSRNDVSSPADMVQLMGIIDRGEGLSEASREAVIKILKHQNFSSIIPARLPNDHGIESAHKTGSLRGIKNDVGIVYSPTVTYAIAFMSKGQDDVPEVVDRMAKASRWIWDYLNA